MGDTPTLKDVDAAFREAGRIQRQVLRAAGWTFSSDYPDHVWRWARVLPGGRTVTANTDEQALNLERALK